MSQRSGRVATLGELARAAHELRMAEAARCPDGSALH